MPIQCFAPMTKDFATFDCDAHVTEPPLIWERAKDFLTRDDDIAAGCCRRAAEVEIVLIGIASCFARSGLLPSMCYQAASRRRARPAWPRPRGRRARK